MTKTLIYAGIGSRSTPKHIQHQMASIAEQLSPNWVLRSGHADGADMAFEAGALAGKGAMEIFIPWFGFNGAPQNDPRYIRRSATQELADYSAQFHPAWDKCSDAAKLLHMRNTCQILGAEGDNPVDLVICWTEGGLGKGGTGQAIRIAEANSIPVFDLAITSCQQILVDYVDTLEAYQSKIAA